MKAFRVSGTVIVEKFDAPKSDLTETFHESILAECVDLPDDTPLGWTYSADFGASEPQLTPEQPKTVRSVHAWQGRIALDQAGKLDAANAIVASLNNPALSVAWEYATEWSRDSAAVNAIGKAIGLDAAAMDALFIAAEKVVL